MSLNSLCCGVHTLVLLDLLLLFLWGRHVVGVRLLFVSVPVNSADVRLYGHCLFLQLRGSGPALLISPLLFQPFHEFPSSLFLLHFLSQDRALMLLQLISVGILVFEVVCYLFLLIDNVLVRLVDFLLEPEILVALLLQFHFMNVSLFSPEIFILTYSRF